MSDDAEASTSSDYQIVEFKDGQLQIVEVTPFDRQNQELTETESLLSDLPEEGSGHHKLMQVFDDKGLVHLDLLNLTLVRCDDNEEAYRLVDNAESDGEANDAIACVIQSSDGEGDNDNGEYIMMGDEQVPLVFLTQSDEQTDTQTNNDMNINENYQENCENNKQNIQIQMKELEKDTNQSTNNNKKLLTPTEILEKVKALQKSSLLPPPDPQSLTRGRCRKRKSYLPPPRQLLALPYLKLFLYSCKRCNFKCNAVKQLTQHRLTEHGPNKSKPRQLTRNVNIMCLRCSDCSYTADSVAKLKLHVQGEHSVVENDDNKPVIVPNGHPDWQISEEQQEKQDYSVKSEQCSLDVLVCGACGFESVSSVNFKKHFKEEHGTILNSS